MGGGSREKSKENSSRIVPSSSGHWDSEDLSSFLSI